MNLRLGPAKNAITIGTDGDAVASSKTWIEISLTLCHLLGLPMPENVEGGIVCEVLEDPNWYLKA